MAVQTLGAESGQNMIGNLNPLIVRRVTRIAIGWRAGKHTAHVTTGAIRRRVRARQVESLSIVIERRRSPPD
jgi:hypothetical protein